MNKKEVIEKFCELATKVGAEVFNHHFAHDCFCGAVPMVTSLHTFQFETPVLDFIVEAVNEKIERESNGTQTQD